MSLGDKFKSGELSRWVVALVLIPPTVATIFLSNKFFLLGWVALVGSLAWWEYWVNLLGRERRGLLAVCLAGFYAVMLGAAVMGPDGQLLGLVLSLSLGGAYFLHVLSPQNDRVSVNLVSRYALGQLYLSFLLSFVMSIKDLASGPQWLVFVILVTALNDTGAFYVGSRLKGPRLAPKISPNKTVSGLLGGCLTAALAAGLSVHYLPLSFSWRQLAALGLFLGLWGAFGDLFESAFKRAMGVKDTSNLLRGHGGFWDRLDSLLFNLPPVYFFVYWQNLP
ncbi:MAG: phosphatidate cytidylyltransferase [Deltaproteobacteria bacterium]|nr:phosphatidate cytidylyltransferase [Deltaproteobacteria bacterium]